MDFRIMDVIHYADITCRQGDSSYAMCICPFCGIPGKGKYKMRVDLVANTYHCIRCDTGGGTVDLYTRLTRGVAYDRSMRAEIIPEMKQALGLEDVVQKKAARQQKTVYMDIDEYAIPEDKELDRVSQGIIHLNLLALNQVDTNKLRKRGLSDADIYRNQYRSVSFECIFSQIPDSFKVLYQTENWNSALQQEGYQQLRRMSMKKLMSCLYIGQQLTDTGICLEGYPGGFALTAGSVRHWGINLSEGILIPIRNAVGQIVAFQTRTEDPERKYMTLSSRGMPEGHSGKARIHHPVRNLFSDKKQNNMIAITEGALKADTFLSLSQAGFRVLALVGVSCTRDLKKELEEMALDDLNHGLWNLVKTMTLDIHTQKDMILLLRQSKSVSALITEFREQYPMVELPRDMGQILEQNKLPYIVQNLFDMDRYTNPNVLRALEKVRRICLEAGMEMRENPWDSLGLVRKLYEVCSWAVQNGCTLPERAKTGVMYLHQHAAEIAVEGVSQELAFACGEALKELVLLLDDRKLVLPDVYRKWSDDCKGIDDYCLTQQQK